MPIQTNPDFDVKNRELAKHPLYVLVIDGLAEPLTTFRPDDAQVSWGGYGLSGYGSIGYGY